MTEGRAVLQRAVKLMRDALILLDVEGKVDAALHLQWAIDLTQRGPPLQPGDELGPLPDTQ